MLLDKWEIPGGRQFLSEFQTVYRWWVSVLKIIILTCFIFAEGSVVGGDFIFDGGVVVDGDVGASARFSQLSWS